MSTVHFPEKTLDSYVCPEWDDIEEAILEVNALSQSRYSTEQQLIQLFNARGKVIAFVSRGIPETFCCSGNLTTDFADPLHLGLNARPTVHECHGVKHSLDLINLNRKGTFVWECPFTRNQLQHGDLSPEHETQQGVYQYALNWLNTFKSENPDYKKSIALLHYPDTELPSPEPLLPSFEDLTVSPFSMRDLWIRDIFQGLSTDLSPRRHTTNW